MNLMKRKKPGRPKLKKNEKKLPLYDVPLHIMVDAEQKEAISQIARLYRRTVSSYIRELIIEQMERHEVK